MIVIQKAEFCNQNMVVMNDSVLLWLTCQISEYWHIYSVAYSNNTNANPGGLHRSQVIQD